MSLRKRFKEYDWNKDALEEPVKKCLDEILHVMENCTKDQLEVKMEILIDEIKKEKKASKMR